MKKKLLSILLCAALVFAMAVPAFAAGSTENPSVARSVGIAFPGKYYSTSTSQKVALKFKVTNTSEYLNVYSSNGIADYKQISTWSWTGASDQKFAVYRGTDNITTIRMYDNMLYGLAKSSSNCILRYLVGLSEDNVEITSIRSEYYAFPIYAWSFDHYSGGCLTATNTNTTVSGGKLVHWESFTSGNTRQIWNVDKI